MCQNVFRQPNQVVCVVIPAKGPRVSSFNKIQRFAIALGKIIEVGSELGKCAVPPGIIGKSNGIEINTVFNQSIIKPAAGTAISSLIMMHENLRPGRGKDFVHR